MACVAAGKQTGPERAKAIWSLRSDRAATCQLSTISNSVLPQLATSNEDLTAASLPNSAW